MKSVNRINWKKIAYKMAEEIAQDRYDYDIEWGNELKEEFYTVENIIEEYKNYCK